MSMVRTIVGVVGPVRGGGSAVVGGGVLAVDSNAVIVVVAMAPGSSEGLARGTDEYENDCQSRKGRYRTKQPTSR
jgi:hypothetical protein